MKPKNWPKKYIYTPESIGVEMDISLLRLALASQRPEDLDRISACIEEKRVHPHLEIRKITGRLSYKGPKPHPLAQSPDGVQYGVFAKETILKGEDLGEFAGEIRWGDARSSSEEKEQTFTWVVRAKSGNFWCVDASRIANELMIVNDYRGLLEAPNAGLKWIVHRGFYYFGYAALKEIRKDEEIVVDYGQRWAALYQEKYARG